MAKEERKRFGSSLQFILSCIGYAVGLGNIWRFPMLAYENGGGSFMVPYLCCSFMIGFPMLYLELSLGQYSQSGPAVVYGKIRPYAQGIGWGMAITSLLVSVYYNVIVSWTLVFIVSIFMSQSKQWALCENYWNDENCLSSLQNQDCSETLKDEEAFYFNASCHNGSSFDGLKELMLKNQSATTQFFENYILQKSDTMEDLGGINWPVFGALIFVWILTALALSKGVKLIGKLSYFTATVPYLIIAILFVRSVTLPGAKKGLDFYLLTIDAEKIFSFEPWQKAATQVCYSLAIGFGGLSSLSSYNPRSHNCFRDALIITCADGFMSIFGGTAVFSILGFMATQQKKEITEVVRSGTGLAFVAYPEAMNQITFVPWLWAFLFFAMLFILGISSQFGLAEVLCTCIYDQFPSTRNKHLTVASSVCFCLFLGGIIMTTKAGIFYFQIFNDYSASFALCILILLELILICYIYGIRNYIKDLRSMFGPPKNCFGKIFGKSGWYFIIVWCIAAPICISVLLVYMLIEQCKIELKYGEHIFPSWSMYLAWFLSVVPLFAIPIVAIANVIHFRAIKKPLKELACVQEDWGATTHETKSCTSSSELDVSPSTTTKTSSPNLYKIRPIEISSTTSDAWNSSTVTAEPGKSQ